MRGHLALPTPVKEPEHKRHKESEEATTNHTIERKMHQLHVRRIRSRCKRVKAPHYRIGIVGRQQA